MTSTAAASPGLPTPAGWIRARFRHWWEARLPRSDTLLLTQGNIYILPARAGWAFAVTLTILLLASINYQLNLGYVLTFLLAGSGLVSMHVTHATLRGLTLHLRPPSRAFARGTAVLELVLTSPSSPRFGIGLRVQGAPDATLAWTDVAAGGQSVARVSFVPPARGSHAVPTLTAETRFPLGLFRAWTVWRPAARIVVYPALETQPPPLPAAQPVAGGPSASRSSDGGEIEGVRAYRRGDPIKLVAWKKAAQALETGSELVSRDTSVSSRRELWIDWAATGGGLDAEAKLSRLAAWIVAAERAAAEFGLRLPGIEIAPESGDAQRRRCLEALALWQLPLPQRGRGWG